MKAPLALTQGATGAMWGWPPCLVLPHARPLCCGSQHGATAAARPTRVRLALRRQPLVQRGKGAGVLVVAAVLRHGLQLLLKLLVCQVILVQVSVLRSTPSGSRSATRAARTASGCSSAGPAPPSEQPRTTGAGHGQRPAKCISTSTSPMSTGVATILQNHELEPERPLLLRPRQRSAGAAGHMAVGSLQPGTAAHRVVVVVAKGGRHLLVVLLGVKVAGHLAGQGDRAGPAGRVTRPRACSAQVHCCMGRQAGGTGRSKLNSAHTGARKAAGGQAGRPTGAKPSGHRVGVPCPGPHQLVQQLLAGRRLARHALNLLQSAAWAGSQENGMRVASRARHGPASAFSKRTSPCSPSHAAMSRNLLLLLQHHPTIYAIYAAIYWHLFWTRNPWLLLGATIAASS